MDELLAKVTDLMSQKLHCSQVMMLLANEVRGVDNPEVVRAVGGLGGGMFVHKNCGTLTGGAAVLASYGARRGPGDEPSYDYRSAIKELAEWFESEFGSAECHELVSGKREDIMETCPAYVEKTFIKCMEILDKYGVDPNES